MKIVPNTKLASVPVSDAPQPEKLVEPPPPPDYLSDKAKDGWAPLAKQLIELGVLTKMDTMALGRLCECFVDILACREAIEKDGRFYWAAGSHGGGTILKPNPAVSALAQCEVLFRSYLGEFGMTPSSRSRVSIKDPTGKKNEFFD